MESRNEKIELKRDENEKEENLNPFPSVNDKWLKNILFESLYLYRQDSIEIINKKMNEKNKENKDNNFEELAENVTMQSDVATPEDDGDSNSKNTESESNSEEKKDKKDMLSRFGTDLTELASKGEIDECFGREKELLELMEILVRRQKNNPVLVGEAGVGKTAVVELFATRLVNNLVPFVLEGRRIVSLDLARIVAGSRYRGEFELRFRKIIDEILNQPNIIVFIDEIHNIGGAGSAEGSLDAANILKPVLSRSGFQCIGATTTKEYEKIEKDAALNRRFQPILIKEPSIDDTLDILYGLRPSLEGFHNVVILPSALRLAAELADRYITDRFLPDNAIDLVDRAAAREVIKMTNVTQNSIVSSIVNAALTNVGKLKIEAFRRGDIGSEYIFQELENAYRNFLLRWIEDPLSIPEYPEPSLSPLSYALFDDMRLTVLSKVEELLFASSRVRKKETHLLKIADLSIEKNEEILKKLDYYPTEELSVYRISLLLFQNWSAEVDFFGGTNVFNRSLAKTFLNRKSDQYLYKIKEVIHQEWFLYSRELDFLSEDIEDILKTYDYISELEEKKIIIFSTFLRKLKPVFRKGIVQSLKRSAELKFKDEELSLIYTLLGYFSTESGKEFLVDLDDPELINLARKTGNFSDLKKRIKQGDIRELISGMTGIPINSISNLESQKLLNLESALHNRVIGQEEAISAIAKAIRRARLGIQNPNRPIASFLFCGPTGVGKTEVTKALAVNMFGTESDMIRFDMSEFMEKFAISRLIGSPPGYVGYDEGGQLTDAVRRKPYSVVLFDEVEKAHPDILNVLLQILEDGRLTDSQKRLISFENTLIIMTSNAAANEIQQIIKSDQFEKIEALKPEDINTYEDEYTGAIKFLESPITENFLTDLKKELENEFEKSFRRIDLSTYKYLDKEIKIAKQKLEQKNLKNETLTTLKNAVLERLSTIFLPEFLNRLDDIIIFQPLKPEELRRICDLMINEVAKRVKGKQLLLNVDQRVREKLTREGYNPQFGARPLRRLVTKYIEDLISESILSTPPSKKERNVEIFLDEDDKVKISIDGMELMNSNV
jgi:ATP-dependent Clp protease ATP-binding subunit ClpA